MTKQGNDEGNYCMMTGKKQKLEDLLDFPTDHRFKIMGVSDELDIDAVIEQMEAICGEMVDRDAMEVRESSGGKYTSYTVPIRLNSPVELNGVYTLLKDTEQVKYYL